MSKKLDQAEKEITAILKKHDIAGVCALHTPGAVNLISHLEPSYSVINQTANAIRARAKLADFGGDRDAWKVKVAGTANMLHGITDAIGPLIIALMDLSKILDEKIGAVHGKDLDMGTELPAKEPVKEDGEYSFTGIAKVKLKPDVEFTSSTLKSIDLRLEISENLDREKYLDANGLPQNLGIKAVTIALMAGLNANIYTAHHKKEWDSADHLRYVLDNLQRMFVENAEITTGEM